MNMKPCTRRLGYPEVVPRCEAIIDHNSCKDRIDCQWTNADVEIQWQCGSATALSGETMWIELECNAISSKARCDRQALCKWKLYEVHPEAECENGGTWQPCRAQSGKRNDHCATTKEEFLCKYQHACQWDGQCACPAAFFGARCQEPVVQFRSNSSQCEEIVQDKDVCIKLVFAASADGETFCTGSNTCADWQSIKRVVHLLYELEVTNLIMDSLGLFLNMALLVNLALVRRQVTCYGKAKRLMKLFTAVIMIPFIADLILESVLVRKVLEVGEPMTTLKQSGCFPIGSSYDTLVNLEEQFETIQTLASVNIAVAISAFLVVWGQCCGGICGEAKLELCTLACALLDCVASLLELALSFFSFTYSTNPILEALLSIEKGFMDKDSKDFCAYRNPLKPAQVAGVEWQTSQHLPWVVPATVLAIISGFILLVFLWPAAEGDSNDEESNDRRSDEPERV